MDKLFAEKMKSTHNTAAYKKNNATQKRLNFGSGELGGPSLINQIASANKSKIAKKSMSSVHQTFLNFGQKSVGMTKCADCHMNYSNGISSDNLLHDAYHKSFVNGITWNVINVHDSS